MSPEPPAGTTAGPAVRGLLDPGLGAGLQVVGDEAVLRALVQTEVAWAQVLADTGAAPASLPRTLTDVLRQQPPDLGQLVARCADGGNPVIPLVAQLRDPVATVDEEAATFLHRGLTSQDVVDTALMLLVRDTLDAVETSLVRVGTALADLAEQHRDQVMAGRTLTQHAVPITMGLKAAQWLVGVLDALEEVRSLRARLPVQCGGAAGTLAATTVLPGAESRADPLGPDGLPARWAAHLGLTWPGMPWHTRRRPLTRAGDVLAGVLDALGHLATDLVVLARPEIGEVVPGAEQGRGGSSTMPHKRNPVGAVLVRAAALQAGPLAGVLHQCAALAVDERSDGAWHAEWPVLQRLCALAVTAASQAAETVEHLDVDSERIERTVSGSSEELLSEWSGLAAALPGATPVPDAAAPADYTGAAGGLTDRALARWATTSGAGS